MFTNIQSFFLKCQWVGGGRESRLILFFKLKYQSAYFLVKKKKATPLFGISARQDDFFFFLFVHLHFLVLEFLSIFQDEENSGDGWCLLMGTQQREYN